MSYVITGGCCNDASCIPVCPADCIRPRPGDPDFLSAEQLYIDPDSCVDCMMCTFECPVSAIHDEHDLPPELDVFKEINAEYFAENPLDYAPRTQVAARPVDADRPPLRVAVVGAGPAGCFAVEQLAQVPGAEVTLLDRLPTPFGLVRSGVAPDHSQTKLMSDHLQKVLDLPGVTCLFNVEVGRDVTVSELVAAHHCVIFSVGAAGDRALGIPGEDLPGSMSARELVAWYNGHPDHVDDVPRLDDRRVVVIGNGNVAIDVARVLASPPELFEATEIAEDALGTLRGSAVREVVVTARRGVADAAYTTAEFLALQRAEGVSVSTLAEEVELGASDADGRFGAARRRELAREAAGAEPDGERRVVFRYMATPVSINGTTHVESVTFRRSDDPTIEETVPAGLVVRAIGYRALPLDGLPYDDATGTVPHERGRVTDVETGAPRTGLYVTGWVKRGATGIIGSNRVDSAETVAELLADWDAGRLADPSVDVEAFRADLVESRPDVVSREAWARIDAEERARGRDAAVARPRSKIATVAEMVRIGLQRPGADDGEA